MCENVSRETIDRLKEYEALLRKWNGKINLVSPKSLEFAWQRHFLDSLQLWPLRPEQVKTWTDLGSGAGFPGLVLAIAALEKMPDIKFNLVESDARKSAFLRTIVLATGVNATIVNTRISDAPLQPSDVVSARALAPLGELLDYTQVLRKENGVCLFLKGESCDTEISEALEKWTFDVEKIPSQTDSRASVLRIGEFRRAAFSE